MARYSLHTCHLEYIFAYQGALCNIRASKVEGLKDTSEMMIFQQILI